MIRRGLIREPFFWLGCVILIYLGLALYVTPDFFYAGGNFELAKSYAEFFLKEKSFSLPANIAPGQPVILAIVSVAAPLSVMTVRLLQVALISLLIFEVYLVAKLLFSHRLALLASVTTALWLPVILQIYSQSVDILFSVLFLCSLYFFLKAEKLHRLDYAAAAGVAAAFAALTDPVGLYFPLFFILPYGVSLLYSWVQARAFMASKHFMLIIVFIGIFALSLMPWYYRNIVVFGGVGNAPLIQKGWETDFIKDTKVRGYVLDTFAPRHFVVVAGGLKQFFLIPFSLDALDRNTELSYKTLALDILNGRQKTQGLTTEEKVVFVFKLVATALHWALLLLAAFGLYLLRREHLTYIYLGLASYLIVATFSYGVLESFRNISPLNGFFFLILPITVILASKGFLFIKENFKNKTLRIENKIRN